MTYSCKCNAYLMAKKNIFDGEGGCRVSQKATFDYMMGGVEWALMIDDETTLEMLTGF